MKFLVDAQLPRRLTQQLRNLGHDTIHTLDLPNGNRSKDSEITDVSMLEQRIVITKDSDFVNSFILSNSPSKLLLVSTGNINNKDLEFLFGQFIQTMIDEFQTHNFIELTRSGFVVHS